MPPSSVYPCSTMPRARLASERPTLSQTPQKLTSEVSIEATAPALQEPKQKTHTNWDALTKAALRPVTIYCQQYQLQRGQTYRDLSCHSRLPIKDAQPMEAHTAGDHGGGFLLCVKQSEGKASTVWADLANREMEAHDFRCAVCDKQVRLHPTNLAPHLRPHAGMTRQAYGELSRNHPQATGFFNVLLKRKQAPMPNDDEPEELNPEEF